MKVNLTIVYTAGSKNISLGHQTRFHSPKEQGKMKWLERRRDESKGKCSFSSSSKLPPHTKTHTHARIPSLLLLITL